MSKTIGGYNPTFHASELRTLVLRTIPSLTGALAEGEQADPHRVMGVLFDYATRAIGNRDIPGVIRCFKLTKQLVELDRECDVVVTSAIWASYLNRFRRDDPAALEIFREIDPQTRATMYSPFTLPHTWLLEVKIDLSGAERRHTRLTVDRPVQAESRLVRQMSCPAHFAVVAIRLEPVLDAPSVLFRNRLNDSDDAPLVYLEAVVEGVERALRSRSGADRGPSHLRIDLLVHDQAAFCESGS